MERAASASTVAVPSSGAQCQHGAVGTTSIEPGDTIVLALASANRDAIGAGLPTSHSVVGFSLRD